MSEQRFDPVKEFINLRDNISKSVGEGLRGMNQTVISFPAVDVYETEEEVVVYTEPMMGVDAASIEVSMEDDVLTISGETAPAVNMPEGAFLLRELRYGPFKREIRIARRVNGDEAAATFSKGVLTITLPKQTDGGSQIIGVTPAE